MKPFVPRSFFARFLACALALAGMAVARAQQSAVNPYTYLGRVTDAEHVAFDTNRVATISAYDASGNLLARTKSTFRTNSRNNYRLDVKPETFSVRNTIILMFDFNSGAARWDPQDTVSGTCSWSFSGLRREGSVVASGPMTLRRVSPLADLVLE